MRVKKDRRKANKLFLAYAIGCADSLLHDGKISQTDYARLVLFAGEEKPPADELDELLERCFPIACENIGRLMHLSFLRNTHAVPYKNALKLEKAFHQERAPDEKLMRKYFDIPVEVLRTLRDHNHVVWYWRIVHYYSKKTPVQIGIVAESTETTKFVPVHIDTETKVVKVVASNLRKLPLKGGDRVFVHGNAIAEPVPQAPEIKRRRSRS